MNSIINLRLTTPAVGKLDTWVIDDKLSTPLNNNVIMCVLTDSEEIASQTPAKWSHGGVLRQYQNTSE